ncbi:MAG: histidine kinase [Rhodobacterales bacterium]|nr:MAG: histidine kinase [Rhodobacterales bacterium]
MNARWALGGILMIATIAGAAMYYLQVYAYYEPVAADRLTQLEMTSILSGEAEPIIADNIEAIDADSSPIRFRACFDSGTSLATMTETYQIYDDAVPLNAPGWFDCFDAGTIGARLESGEAIAFLGTKNISYGVDRVIAVDATGRGYAWHQINRCGEAVFEGDPLPQGCPPPPEGTAR